MLVLPKYIHLINPKLKHTYLTFNEEGMLIIKSPKVSQKYLEQLLLKKASWITASKKKIREKKGKALDFSQDPKIYFLGKPYALTLTAYNKKRNKLTFNCDRFTLFYSHYDVVAFQAKIDKFYKEESKHYITKLVKKWADKMNLNYKQISFRKTKRQWGSCSSQNALSFNTMMMKLPVHVIEYIVVHELAHIKHKHHQKAFWNLVALYIPDYKERMQILKQYST